MRTLLFHVALECVLFTSYARRVQVASLQKKVDPYRHHWINNGVADKMERFRNSYSLLELLSQSNNEPIGLPEDDEEESIGLPEDKEEETFQKLEVEGSVSTDNELTALDFGLLFLAFKLAVNPLKALGALSLALKCGAAAEEPSSGRAATIGAAAIGGVLGIQIFHGLSSAVVLALILAYTSTLTNNVGGATKMVGLFAVKAWTKIRQINDQYEVLWKAKNVTDVVMQAAKGATDKVLVVVDKVNPKPFAKIDNKFKLSQALGKLSDKVKEVERAIKGGFSKSKDENISISDT